MKIDNKTNAKSSLNKPESKVTLQDTPIRNGVTIETSILKKEVEIYHSSKGINCFKPPVPPLKDDANEEEKKAYEKEKDPYKKNVTHKEDWAGFYLANDKSIRDQISSSRYGREMEADAAAFNKQVRFGKIKTYLTTFNLKKGVTILDFTTTQANKEFYGNKEVPQEQKAETILKLLEQSGYDVDLKKSLIDNLGKLDLVIKGPMGLEAGELDEYLVSPDSLDKLKPVKIEEATLIQNEREELVTKPGTLQEVDAKDENNKKAFNDVREFIKEDPSGLKGGSRLALLPDIIDDIKGGNIMEESLTISQRNALRQAFGDEKRAFEIIKNTDKQVLMQEVARNESLLKQLDDMQGNQERMRQAFGPMEAAMALANDHQEMVKAMQEQFSAYKENGWELADVEPHFDFTEGTVRFSVRHANGEEMELSARIPKDRLLSHDLLTRYEGLLAEPTPGEKAAGKVNKALGVYGVVAGFYGGVQALQKGDVTKGTIDLLQSAQGTASLTGADLKLYRAAGRALGKSLENGLEKVSAKVTESFGGELGKMTQSVGSSLLESAGNLGRFAEQGLPLIGSGFAFYNAVEEFKQGTPLGYIDGALDTGIGVLGLLGPEAEPAVLALMAVRMTIDDAYRDFKAEFDKLPEDASIEDKLKAAGNGYLHTMKDITQKWAPWGWIWKAVELDKQHDRDVQLIKDLEDPHNFYRELKEKDSTVKEIDFVGEKLDSYEGGIVFRMGEPGESSTIEFDYVSGIDKTVKKTQQVQLSKNTKDIVLGVGEASKLSWTNDHVTFFFIPAKNVKVLGKSTPVEKSMVGEYHGNNQGNRFIAVQKQAKNDYGKEVGPILRNYLYKLYGGTGDDTFYLGPQKFHIVGGGGSNTYILRDDVVSDEIIINNYNSGAGQSILRLGKDSSVNHLHRQGDNLEVEVGKVGNASGKSQQVTLKSWYKGKAYQGLLIQQGEGEWYRVSEEVKGRPSLSLFRVKASDGERLDASQHGAEAGAKEFALGSGNKVIGNQQDNQFYITGTDNHITGGGGANQYYLDTKDNTHTDLVIDNKSAVGKLSTLRLSINYDQLKANNEGKDLILKWERGSVRILNWATSPKYRQLQVLTKDGLYVKIAAQSEAGYHQLIPTVIELENMNQDTLNLGDERYAHVVRVDSSKQGGEIIGNNQTNIFIGKGGTDHFVGTGGANMYFVDLTKGNDTYINNHSTDGKVDTLNVAANYGDLNVFKKDDNLIIQHGGKKSVIIENYFRGGDYQHLRIRTQDKRTFFVDPKSVEKKVLSVELSNPKGSANHFDLKTAGGGFESTLKVSGSQGVDILEGNDHSNVLDGKGVSGLGADRLIGHNGSNTYIVRKGYGNTIIDNHSTDGKTDILQLDEDVNNLHLVATDNHLIVSNKKMSSGEFDRITSGEIPVPKDYFAVLLGNWFKGKEYQHLVAKSGDGTLFGFSGKPGEAKLIPLAINRKDQESSQDIDLNKDGLSFVKEIAGSALESNTIKGNDRGNTIIGGKKSDRLYGGKGNDTFNGGWGENFIDGAGGVNTVKFNGNVNERKGVDVELNNGSAIGSDGKKSKLINIQNVEGTIFNDRLVGSRGNNVLRSPGGANTFVSYSGNDQLIAGNGKDRFEIYMNLNSAINTFKNLNSADYENKVVTVDLTKSKGAKIKLYGIDPERPMFKRVANNLEISQKAETTKEKGLVSRKVIIKDYFGNNSNANVTFVFPSNESDEEEANLKLVKDKIHVHRDTFSHEPELIKLNQRIGNATNDDTYKTVLARYQKLREETGPNPGRIGRFFLNDLRAELDGALRVHNVTFKDVERRDELQSKLDSAKDEMNQLVDQRKNLERKISNRRRENINKLIENLGNSFPNDPDSGDILHNKLMQPLSFQDKTDVSFKEDVKQESLFVNTSHANNLQLVQAMNSMGSGEKTGLDDKASRLDKNLINVKPVLSHRH